MPAKKKKSKASAPEKTNSAATRFPKNTLEQSLRIPRAILEQNAGRECTPKEAAGFLGIKVTGPFNTELASSSRWGFLERPEKGKVRPSELAKKVLRPQDPRDELQGYRDAVLKTALISDVYNHYRGENLPDDKFFANALTDKFSIPADQVPEFRDIFVNALEKAQLLSDHGDKTRVLDVTSEQPTASATVSPSPTLEKLAKSVKVGSGDSCFVMMPFADPHGPYYDKIYAPAIEKAGLKPVRADASIFGTGKIIDQIWSGINAAKVLVAEMTTKNPNVFYELGLAHALQKPVVLVSSNENDVPFDLKHMRVIYYDMTDPFWGNKLIEKVAENILSAIQNPEEAIFKAPV